MSDAAELHAWRETVEREWLDEATAAAWKRWHDKIVVQSAAATEALVGAARVRPGARVLDLASGSGDPALTLAREVAPDGIVTATDLSPRMLAVAATHARAEGVENVDFRVADAHRLPFDDRSFDAVTCRFGAMYFVEPVRAFAECRRVLVDGGRIALAAWGPLDEIPYLRLALEPFARRVPLPSPDPRAPHPLRYGNGMPGSLAHELRAAGFDEVEEEWSRVSWPWPGTPEEMWLRFYEGAVPFQPIVDGLPTEEREAAIGEAIAAFAERYDGERVQMEVTIVVASGTRV